MISAGIRMTLDMEMRQKYKMIQLVLFLFFWSWRSWCGFGLFWCSSLEIVSWCGSLEMEEKDCAGWVGRIMSPSLKCRHIIATLRFQLNFQGAFFRERGMRSKGGFFQNLPEKERSISQMGKVVKLAIQNIHRLNTYLHTHTNPFTYGHAFYL